MRQMQAMTFYVALLIDISHTLIRPPRHEFWGLLKCGNSGMSFLSGFLGLG